MSIKTGLDYSENGLIFAFDTNDTNTSYFGETTTNIAYATNSYLNSNSNWWFNSGSSILNDNDTSLAKPVIPNVDTTNLRIFSSEVTASGNQHIGSAIIPVAPSLDYTFSIYFWFQGSSMQAQPYVRSAANNNSLVYFDYNGDTNIGNLNINSNANVGIGTTSPSFKSLHKSCNSPFIRQTTTSDDSWNRWVGF